MALTAAPRHGVLITSVSPRLRQRLRAREIKIDYPLERVIRRKLRPNPIRTPIPHGNHRDPLALAGTTSTNGMVRWISYNRVHRSLRVGLESGNASKKPLVLCQNSKNGVEPGSGKGVRHQKCEAPEGPFRLLVSAPFSRPPKIQGLTKH